jgi:hypothetical protein
VSGDGSVGIVTGLQMNDTDLNSGGKEFFFSPGSPDLFLAPHNQPSTGH